MIPKCKLKGGGKGGEVQASTGGGAPLGDGGRAN